MAHKGGSQNNDKWTPDFESKKCLLEMVQFFSQEGVWYSRIDTR
jgi:hypothetical protein